MYQQLRRWVCSVSRWSSAPNCGYAVGARTLGLPKLNDAALREIGTSRRHDASRAGRARGGGARRLRAQEHGIDVTRRPTAHPSAVLGIEVVKRKRRRRRRPPRSELARVSLLRGPRRVPPGSDLWPGARASRRCAGFGKQPTVGGPLSPLAAVPTEAAIEAMPHQLGRGPQLDEGLRRSRRSQRLQHRFS